MAGHSKWNNIKRTKAVIDSKKAAQFTKVAREITTIVSVTKNGDIASNPMLKTSVDRAKALNMTKDKIEKAINRGLGVKDKDTIIHEKTYEIYGPGGSLFLVECETDNPNRSLTDMKIISNRYNLKFANEGSISWQFSEVGVIEIKKLPDAINQEISLIEINGVEDIKEEQDKFIVYCKKENLKKVRDLIESINYEILSFNIIKKVNDLIKLENLDEVNEIENEFLSNADVVNVWKNYYES